MDPLITLCTKTLVIRRTYGQYFFTIQEEQKIDQKPNTSIGAWSEFTPLSSQMSCYLSSFILNLSLCYFCVVCINKIYFIYIFYQQRCMTDDGQVLYTPRSRSPAPGYSRAKSPLYQTKPTTRGPNLSMYQSTTMVRLLNQNYVNSSEIK